MVSAVEVGIDEESSPVKGGKRGASGQVKPRGLGGELRQTSKGTKQRGLQRSNDIHLQAGTKVGSMAFPSVVDEGTSIESQVTLVVL